MPNLWENMNVGPNLSKKIWKNNNFGQIYQKIWILGQIYLKNMRIMVNLCPIYEKRWILGQIYQKKLWEIWFFDVQKFHT